MLYENHSDFKYENKTCYTSAVPYQYELSELKRRNKEFEPIKPCMMEGQIRENERKFVL
jgi:hypothetical protein